jgi:aspartyl-tRNA(Asn)/glutamyl-tRNA(Gln) amidotransferase subunit A
MGRVPLYPGTKDHRYPGVSSWESLEHIGPLTRTVADAALVLSVIAGYDDRDRLSIPSDDIDWQRAVDGDLRGLRVAYSPDLGYAAVDPAVRTVTDQAVTVFERDLGCAVERADPGWEDPYEALLPLIVCESDLAGMRRLADELGERMSPHLVDVLRLDWTAEQLTTAVVRRKAVYNAAWRFFRSYGLLVTRRWRCRCSSTACRAGHHRRARGRRLLLVVVHLPVQLHRPAGGHGPRRAYRRRPPRQAADRRRSAGRRAGAAGLGGL